MRSMIILLVLALISVMTASASELNIEQMLKSTAESSTYSAVGSDEASSYAWSNSEDDSVSTLTISGVTTIGDSTLAGAFSQGEGDDIHLSSILHMEGDVLSGEGGAYATGDTAGTESSSSAENGEDYNTIDIEMIANAIGDASGYTWVIGWE